MLYPSSIIEHHFQSCAKKSAIKLFELLIKFLPFFVYRNVSDRPNILLSELIADVYKKQNALSSIINYTPQSSKLSFTSDIFRQYPCFSDNVQPLINPLNLLRLQLAAKKKLSPPICSNIRKIFRHSFKEIDFIGGSIIDVNTPVSDRFTPSKLGLICLQIMLGTSKWIWIAKLTPCKVPKIVTNKV